MDATLVQLVLGATEALLVTAVLEIIALPARHLQSDAQPDTIPQASIYLALKAAWFAPWALSVRLVRPLRKTVQLGLFVIPSSSDTPINARAAHTARPALWLPLHVVVDTTLIPVQRRSQTVHLALRTATARITQLHIGT